MAKQVSLTSTKKELLDAYNKMVEQASKTDTEPTQQQLISKKEKAVEEVKGMSSESIIKNIAGLKTSITQSLDMLETQMVGSYKELRKLQDTIQVENDNLKELYDITANAHSLSALITAQKERKENFDKEMENTRLLWENEKKHHEKEAKEFKELQVKDRKREEEEYLYDLKLKRKKEEDTYNDRKNQLEKELAAKKTTFEKEISDRELKIKESETELAELRKKSSEFPKLLESEILKAVKQAEEKLKQQFDFEKQLSGTKMTGETILKDQTIESLKEKIKDQEVMIKQLSQKVNVSEESVKQIALKALDSSSKEKIVAYEKSSDKKD
jgi:hypothetical protein